jgi:CysZ protein
MIARFAKGMRFFGRGFRVAFGRGELVPFVLAPALLAVAVTTGGTALARRSIEGFVASRWPHPGTGAGIVIWLATGLAMLGVGYILYNVSCILATAPFAGVLAERAHHVATGEKIAPRKFSATLASSFWGAWHAVIVAVMYLSLSLSLFVAQWILLPLLPLVWMLTLIQSAYFFAFDAFNEPLHRARTSFAGKWRFVFAHGAESLGFGVAVALCMMLPLVSLVVAPVAVVGGALLHVELSRAPASDARPAA